MMTMMTMSADLGIHRCDLAINTMMMMLMKTMRMMTMMKMRMLLTMTMSKKMMTMMRMSAVLGIPHCQLANCFGQPPATSDPTLHNVTVQRIVQSIF